MSYRGHIEAGKVVFDVPAPLAEGTQVRVEVLAESGEADLSPHRPTMAEELASVIGKAEGLPRDCAENHDKYLRDEHAR